MEATAGRIRTVISPDKRNNSNCYGSHLNKTHNESPVTGKKLVHRQIPNGLFLLPPGAWVPGGLGREGPCPDYDH